MPIEYYKNRESTKFYMVAPDTIIELTNKNPKDGISTEYSIKEYRKTGQFPKPTGADLLKVTEESFMNSLGHVAQHFINYLQRCKNIRKEHEAKALAQ